MSGIPDLMNGDVVLTPSVKQYYFTDTGNIQVGYSAGRKQKFVLLLLGAVENGKETEIDLDELLRLNGLMRIPE
jgi:hypothetical protein